MIIQIFGKNIESLRLPWSDGSKWLTDYQGEGYNDMVILKKI